MTDISAFQLWLCSQQTLRSARPLAAVPDYHLASANLADLPAKDIASLNLPHPLHLAVPSRAGIRRSRIIVSHLLANPPSNSFVRIKGDVYAASPALALMTVAARIPFGARVAVVNQMLGAYRLRAGGMIAAKPMVGLADLTRFLNEAKGMNGAKALRPVLPRAIENTASPAESKLGALLTISRRMGGCGLPAPISNAWVNTSGLSSATKRYADFLWPDERLILEYDSDEHHTGVEKLALDSARRAQLQAAGYTVLSLTNHQLWHPQEFNDVISVLRKALGRKPERSVLPEFTALETKLRNEIYGFDPATLS